MRILIVKVSSMGDIIHTLPALTDACRARPELRVDWVVEEGFTEIPAWHPAVERVIPVAIRRWRAGLPRSLFSGEIGRFRQCLKREYYDLVIDPQGLIKSAIISRWARGLTVGLSDTTIKEPLATLFYNKKYSVPRDMHAVQRVRELFARALNYRFDGSVIHYGIDLARLDVSPPERPGGDRATLLFLHGTTWRNKHWPERYWRELLRLALDSGYHVELPWGSAEERARAKRLAAGNEGARVLEKQTLTSLAGHLANAAGVVAVDTGLAHLAAALEVPAVSLYGPTDPGLSGTYGHYQQHVLATIDCAPCLKRRCAYRGEPLTDLIAGERFRVEPPCFAATGPERVLAMLQQQIAARQTGTQRSTA